MSAKANKRRGDITTAEASAKAVPVPHLQDSGARKTPAPVRNGHGAKGDSGDERGVSRWGRMTLGEVARIERGKFSHRPRNEPRFYGGNTPFVQTGDVTRSNGIVRTHTQTLNEDGVAISKVFPAGTILITIAANIGYAGILEFDSAAPDSLIGLTPNDAVSAEFLNFYLTTQQPEMDRMAPKGTQKNINIEFLKPWPVVVPPLPEQKKIAHILSTVQRAIEAQERIIQTTTELKKALMHKIFTEGLRGEPQKQTEIGPVPESWEVVELGELLEIAQYGMSVKGNPEGNHPILRMTNQVDGQIVGRNLQFVQISDGEFERFRVRRGDILFNRTNSLDLVGRTAIFDIEGEFVFASYLIRLRTDGTKLNPFFLNCYFNTDEIQARLKSIATRAVSQSNISATRLRGFPVPKPRLEEQDEIVAHAIALDRKLAIHRAKLEQLQDLFRTLLHELMTAKTRVANLHLT